MKSFVVLREGGRRWPGRMKKKQQLPSALQSARKQRPGSALVETIEIDGSLDLHALEVLKLELRQLATLYGFEVSKVAVTTIAGRSKRRPPRFGSNRKCVR
jgi:hypothetical protein